ncbi:MAG: hypothetical protein MK135_02745 [Polyangiaceae bacterium]|nr:hypothetical protein [Polyangiaceae bacterium]
MNSFGQENVNYESDPLLSHVIQEQEYRLDAGKEGTALCLSERKVGTWDWSLIGEAKWDRTTLRCKSLPRPITEELSRALRELNQA